MEKGFVLEPKTPYAELWMGTHPSGPSTLAETGQDLREYVADNPQVLGDKSRGRVHS